MNILVYPLLIIAMWIWSTLFFWLIQKPVFSVVNLKSSSSKPLLADVVKIYRKGAVSDFIIASYLSAVPIIAGYIGIVFPSFNFNWILIPYAIIAGIAIGLITVGDTALYGFWQSKIDASVFAYLRHPKGAFASVSGLYLIIAFTCAIIVAAVFAGGWIIIDELFKNLYPSSPLSAWGIVAESFIAIAMIGIAFLIIRGLKIRPNNPSVVYFSPVAFFNHWALNPAYNLIYSLGTRNEFKGKFHSFDDAECQKIFTPLFPTSGKTRKKLLNTETPNILVIVWESFGARFCEKLGGKPDVTPCFNKLCDEGILFADCRSSSFRTDRALPAVFCGLPAQPTTSIIRYTRKLANLPAFPVDLRNKGYDTMAVHGGDLTIMHKSDFYLSSGHSRLMSQKDFPADCDSGKWGVHDGPVMDYIYDEVMKRKDYRQPWLITVQTLSSHEPFKVPYSRLDNEEDNSMAYTDASIGSLVDRLKDTPAWNNLLIVIVADHGLNNGDPTVTRENYSHIPMLWTGGAVKSPEKIDTLMSQTDLAATLLGQLNMPHSHFPFSRDIFADTYLVPSAFHSYVNGFMFSDETGATDYDTLAGKPIPPTGNAAREKKGLAILQTLYEYLDKI